MDTNTTIFYTIGFFVTLHFIIEFYLLSAISDVEKKIEKIEQRL